MGLSTGENNRFYRFQWEVSNQKIYRKAHTREEAKDSGRKWFPCNRGGEFRRWYGNTISVIDWSDDGYSIINNYRNGKQLSRPQNLEWSFKPGLTWNLITSGLCSVRFLSYGFLFDQAGCMCFPQTDEYSIAYLGAFLNSSVLQKMLDIVNPSLNCPPGTMGGIPIVEAGRYTNQVSALVQNNVSICKIDWESYEMSEGFLHHPLI